MSSDNVAEAQQQHSQHSEQVLAHLKKLFDAEGAGGAAPSEAKNAKGQSLPMKDPKMPNVEWVEAMGNALRKGIGMGFSFLFAACSFGSPIRRRKEVYQ